MILIYRLKTIYTQDVEINLKPNSILFMWQKSWVVEKDFVPEFIDKKKKKEKK